MSGSAGWQFVVSGEPVAWQRPRLGRRKVGGRVVVRAYRKRGDRVTAFRQHVALAARAAGVRPIEGPVEIEIEFILSRPARERARRQVVPADWCVKRPDLDNLAKGVLDALTGFAWIDDAQVVYQVVRKRWAAGDEPAITRVRVAPIQGTVSVAK